MDIFVAVHQFGSRPAAARSTAAFIGRTRKNLEYVCLRDMPPLPRYYLKRYLSLSNRRKVVPGDAWRKFMQKLASGSALLSVGVLM